MNRKTRYLGLEMLRISVVFGLEMNEKTQDFGLEMKNNLYLRN